MINQKYYQDIKAFPHQFPEGLTLAQNFIVPNKIHRVVVCGMGGSSLFVELVNDFLASKGEAFRVDVVRGYDLPSFSDEHTLFVICSYSGNTEEVTSCLDQVKAHSYPYVIFTSGGLLLKDAQSSDVPLFHIPGGIQPRLSTGYFITGLVRLLSNLSLIKNYDEELVQATAHLDDNLDEEYAKELATKIQGSVPIIYATDENSSIARICKIKFNENSKTQAFWNYFPELNHNEMVGFTNLEMRPFFLLLESQFTHDRNKARINTFIQVMSSQDVQIEHLSLQGATMLEEMMNVYYLIDHVTYYLAEANEVDPEPVAMVEHFKELLRD